MFAFCEIQFGRKMIMEMMVLMVVAITGILTTLEVRIMVLFHYNATLQNFLFLKYTP